jgi:hypothetical protein
VVNVLFVPQPGPGLQGWPVSASLIEQIDDGNAPPAPPSPPNSRRYAGPEQALAVQCSDSPNPHDPAVFTRLAALSFARAGDIGPAWSWADEPCASWPATAADRYAGPWDRPTSAAVLVIGNTGDPSTPYAGAMAMSGLLGRARLLTIDGYGHTALLNPSTCANDYESAYFLRGALPPPATVCQQDRAPFTTP